MKSKYIGVICFYSFLISGIEYLTPFGNITSDRIISPILVLTIFMLFVAGARIRLSLTPGVLISLWLTLAFISSLTSPVNEWSLKMFLALSLSLVYYILGSLFAGNVESFVNSRWFAAIALILGPISVLIYTLHFMSLNLDWLNFWIQEGAGGYRIKATLAEANILGAFMILFMLIIIDKIRNKIDAKINAFALTFMFLTFIFTFSRGPWLAFVGSLFVYYFISYGRPYTSRNLTSKLLIGSLGVVFSMFIGVAIFLSLQDFEIIGRINTLETRFIMWDRAFEGINNNPWIGNGIFSFSELHPDAPIDVGSDSYRAAWISNLFLAILHDTGLFGLIIFCLFFIIVFVRAWYAIRGLSVSSYKNINNSGIYAAFYAYGVSLIISGLTIPSHSMGYFWFAFGVLSTLNSKINKYYLDDNNC